MSVSKREDPLEKQSEAPDRLFYAQGVLLDAQDFNAEQTYHRSRLARALFYLHGSGTAAGLRVEWQKALISEEDPDFPEGRQEQIVVYPGVAVDRLGRIIEVPRNVCIRLNHWYQAQTPDDLRQGFHGAPINGVVVDVFIRFVACERGKTPAFAAGPFDALDAVVPSRLRDSFQLELVIRKEAHPSLPQSSWPDLAAIADVDERRAALVEAIFDAWREGTRWSDQEGLVPLPEHARGQDSDALFLARCVIPAVSADTADTRPNRLMEEPVQVDNTSRSFVYAGGALARWLGI